MHKPMESAPIVGLVTVATGRYVDFLPPLVESARKHLIGLGPVYVLTDTKQLESAGDVRILEWPRMEWPLPTLLRYRAFCQYAPALSEVDVLLYTDADMLFVGDVDVRAATGLIAVRHPGYVDTPVKHLPYERRETSSACVPPEAGAAYFCGGVQGGLTSAYLAAAADIDGRIAQDQAQDVMAAWHDESHWNKHLTLHPAEMQLGDEYCTPDTDRTSSSRILAITKDHAHYRNLSGAARALAALKALRHRLARRVHKLLEVLR